MEMMKKGHVTDLTEFARVYDLHSVIEDVNFEISGDAR